MSSVYGFAFRSFLYPLYETRLRGRKTLRYLAEYERQQWIEPEAMRRLQLDRVRALLEHCQRNVPFYRERWRELGFDWRDVRDVSDLQRLPLTSKDDIRRHYEAMGAEDWRGRTLRKSTGGSTGQPFHFEYTRESYERRMAVMMRGYGWAGASFGAKRLDVWGTDVGDPPWWKRTKARLFDAALRRRVLGSFHMRDDNLADYVAEIDRYRPEVIVGYTSALETLARWIDGHRAPAWRPRSVLTAAEMLSDAQRALIEKAFGAPVFHTYGCREFMLLGAECEHHTGYHLSADHLVVEVADDAGQVVSEGVGQVVVTDLSNLGMPFVRYANGDLARAHPAPYSCPCGRGLPLMGAVEGRRLDMLRTPDGRIVPGEFFPHLMKEVAAVGSFQVRQKRLDRLDILVVPRGELRDDDEAFLRREIAKVFGGSIEITVERVADIPLTPTGKRRVTVSELPATLP
ncbi:MAG: hypothetical protein O9345_03995 [Burkholderiaceae bacterium]|nr:phenylacetate--CoA ligase family protein [Burkholderiales bacterium]MCZ8108154.1 hypothetical protein [Burkholderiales bacterium]MCZ8337309.1 hypothetical protein [Burkholderiaceae bacterium]